MAGREEVGAAAEDSVSGPGSMQMRRSNSVMVARAAILLLFSLLTLGVVARADETEQTTPHPETGKEARWLAIGFLTFGDLYAVGSHHLPEAEDDVGFWVRRVYLTFGATLSKHFLARLRFEANQEGDFEGSAFTVDFKDVYLRWSIGRHRLFAGLAPTPTFNFIEEVWGLRYLEKTPLDLQGIPSRDTGIAAHGPLFMDGWVSYRAMVGTGADYGKETGEGQKSMGAVTLGEDRAWTLDVYLDFQELPGATDWTTYQVFGAYRHSAGRVGVQYSYQDREEDPRLEVASAFGLVELSRMAGLIGRVDRLLEPSPKGNDIPYLPFDPTARATLLIAGIELRLHQFLKLTPNVEVILYDDPDEGEKPKDDFLMRLTYYFHI